MKKSVEICTKVSLDATIFLSPFTFPLQAVLSQMLSRLPRSLSSLFQLSTYLSRQFHSFSTASSPSSRREPDIINPQEMSFFHGDEKPKSFMGLPSELRYIIFRMVFDADHVIFDFANTEFEDPIIRTSHWGQKPLAVSRNFYNESRAVYLGHTQFHLHSIPILRRFLVVIGPIGRRLLTSIRFKYTPHGAVNTFKLLRECSSLRTLGIIVRVEAAPYRWDKNRLEKRSGMEQLVLLRGINHLDLQDIQIKRVHLYGYPGVDFNQNLRPVYEEDKKKFKEALQVMKLPRGLDVNESTLARFQRSAVGSGKPRERKRRLKFERTDDIAWN